MTDHNHTGHIKDKNRDGTPLTVVNRRTGPGITFPKVAQDHGSLAGGTQVIVLCYTLGEREITFDNPDGTTSSSRAWDFVVTSDRDPGGYVADVLVFTEAPIEQQLGDQGTCSHLVQRLTPPPSSPSPGVG